MVRIVPRVRDRDEDLRNILGAYQCYVPSPGMMENNFIDVHCHIDPLCIGPWLCFCHIVAPLCILFGCDLIQSWRYGSTLYFRWPYI
jgi:hypothetical protein